MAMTVETVSTSGAVLDLGVDRRSIRPAISPGWPKPWKMALQVSVSPFSPFLKTPKNTESRALMNSNGKNSRTRCILGFCSQDPPLGVYRLYRPSVVRYYYYQGLHISHAGTARVPSLVGKKQDAVTLIMLAGRSFAGRAVCCLLLFPFTKKTAPLFFFSMSDATMRVGRDLFPRMFSSFPFSLLSPNRHSSIRDLFFFFFSLQVSLSCLHLKHTHSLTQSQAVLWVR